MIEDWRYSDDRMELRQKIYQLLLTRFVFPFELVSFVLLGALIGGITLARKDNALMDEDQI